MLPVYCKYSNDRDKRFKIKTTIEMDGSTKRVCKEALCEEGKEHINNMLLSYNKLKDIYANVGVELNHCALENGKAMFDYIESPTIESIADNYLVMKDYEKIDSIFDKYVAKLTSVADIETFVPSEDFKRVFGDFSLEKNLKAASFSNIDLVFENIFVSDGRYTVIDYEWSFDFAVPIEFVLYRTIFYYVHGSTKREVLIDRDYFKRYGISEDDKKIYEQMEDHFQEYVAGQEPTLAKLSPMLLKRKTNAVEIAEDRNKSVSSFLQIYSVVDGVLRENKSKVYNYDTTCGDEIYIEVPVKKEECLNRIDLVDRNSMVEVKSVYFKDEENSVVELSYITNGTIYENKIIFENVDPNIILRDTPYKDGTICITFIVHDYDFQISGLFGETIKEITAKCNETGLHEKDLMIHDRDRVIDDMSLQIAFQQTTIDKFHRLPTYKVYKKFKNAGRTLKEEGVGGVCRKIKRKITKDSAPVPVSESYKAKYVLVVHEAQKAGASLLSLNIAKTFSKLFNEHLAILLMCDGPLAEEFEKYGKVYHLQQQSPVYISNKDIAARVVGEIAANGAKYVLCNTILSGLVLEYFNRYNVKSVTMVHEMGASIDYYGFESAGVAVKNYADNVVFASELVKKEFQERFPVDDSKCHIIPQGMYVNAKLSRFDEKKDAHDALCQSMNIPTTSKIVLGCGYADLRKGLDWFAQVAKGVLKGHEDTRVIWLGNYDESIKNWVSYDMAREGVADRFIWTGHVDNPSDYFAGADCFLLSSREDPFPSVALEAMAHFTPVVAFDGTGGIPEVLKNDLGYVVDYGDCIGCAKTILSIVKGTPDDEMLSRAKKYVDKLTPSDYVRKLINLVRGKDDENRVIDVTHKVSVVIPNYNYERYLEERIDCIINQTYQPHEIIFLDDVSTDNSVKRAEEILSRQDKVKYRIIPNDKNNGCFRQWLKGIELAEGDLIWVAEADDLCTYDFLESVVPAFEDDEVNLSYAQSEVIYDEGEHSGYIYTEYTKDLDPVKWTKDFVNVGQYEIVQGLGIKNTIPNASGVVMRRTALEGIGEELKDYGISGDWFAYVYLIRTGKIAFCSSVHNFHRRHRQSIIGRKEQDINLFIELLKIKLFIAENYTIPAGIKDRFISHVKNEFGRLMPEGTSFEQYEELVMLQKDIEDTVNGKLDKFSFLENNPPKNLLFVAPDFEMGGGQMLIIRLANYFARFHNVYVYNARPWQEEERIRKMFSANVTILNSTANPKELAKYIADLKIDTINSHIWWSDKIVYKAIENNNKVNWVLAMHGCYEAILEHPDWDEDFRELAPKVLNRANNVIIATDKNRKIFEVVDIPESKIHKIYYGYELQSIPRVNLEELGIHSDDFVFGLVARGIQSKGFEEAILALEKIKDTVDRPLQLILVGNGEFIDGLKKKYEHIKNIHFIDNITKPSGWIGYVKAFDVALLPTYFISESLPNSVIEYLAYEKPVVTTDIGDIKYMIIDGDSKAGILLKLHDNTVSVDELAEAMKTMVVDKEAFSMYKSNTAKLFEQFDIKTFAENYYRYFR